MNPLLIIITVATSTLTKYSKDLKKVHIKSILFLSNKDVEVPYNFVKEGALAVFDIETSQFDMRLGFEVAPWYILRIATARETDQCMHHWRLKHL